MPLFIITSRKLMDTLREIARKQLEAQAQNERHDERDIEYWRSIAGEIVRAKESETKRLAKGLLRCVIRECNAPSPGSIFFAIVGLISAVGTSLVYGLGGYYVIIGSFTVGTIVAFVPIWAAFMEHYKVWPMRLWIFRPHS